MYCWDSKQLKTKGFTYFFGPWPQQKSQMIKHKVCLHNCFSTSSSYISPNKPTWVLTPRSVFDLYYEDTTDIMSTESFRHNFFIAASLAPTRDNPEKVAKAYGCKPYWICQKEYPQQSVWYSIHFHLRQKRPGIDRGWGSTNKEFKAGR